MWAQATCGKVILPSEFHFIEVCTSVGYLLKKNSHNLLSYFLLKKKKKKRNIFKHEIQEGGNNFFTTVAYSTLKQLIEA